MCLRVVFARYTHRPRVVYAPSTKCPRVFHARSMSFSTKGRGVSSESGFSNYVATGSNPSESGFIPTGA
eukprot:2584134-Lingulodinium_polyedra.AAC.1